MKLITIINNHSEEGNLPRYYLKADTVYISLDINGLTIECSPHNGMVVAGGLRFPEVVYLLDKIVDSGRRIVGFDLSEVVPDMDDKTDAAIAARLLYNICSMALKNHDAPMIL